MTALAPRDRTLGELLGSEAGSFARLPITDLTLDSREAAPGAAFVAVRGAHAHGLQYASDALACGAAIVLYEPSTTYREPPSPSVAVRNLKARLGELAQRFFALPPALRLVGVTGTNGKTTVAWLVAQALAAPARACAYIGTLGFGVPPRLTPHALTTPDTFTLHRELAQLGAPRAALEVSSHALAQDRIAGLAFDTAVFTNLTRDHLDEHGDFAAYGRAKARLFERLELRHAVLNADDPFAVQLASGLPRGCELIRTSTRRAPAELLAHIRSSSLAGLDLELHGKYGTGRLASPLVGEFNAENLLGALGALLASGLPLTDAAAALARARAAPGRLEVFGGPPAQPWVVVDYAHTPDALARTLDTLAAVAVGELAVVFGCGGDRDRGKRPLMGAVAAARAARIVLTDDNPRSEDPAAIVREIAAGVGAHADLAIVHDRHAAIASAVERACVGDIVLVAGKGHETVQLAGGERRPFDDRAVVAALLGSGS